MIKKQLQKIALEYLEGNRLMTLATSAKNKPWASTVFFAYDNKFNLYFFSRPDTKHCQNIKLNSNVAAAINQDWGTKGLIKGFQMSGQAAKVSKKDHVRGYEIFSKRHKWADQYKDHVLYRIQPDSAYHINQEVFGHFFRVQVV